MKTSKKLSDFIWGFERCLYTFDFWRDLMLSHYKTVTYFRSTFWTFLSAEF